MSLYLIKKNKVITMTRGDSTSLKIEVNTSDFPAQINTGDLFFFGVMEPNQPFEKAIIKKELAYENYDSSHGTLKIDIEPEDTIELIPGTYYYQIKVLSKNDGDPRIDTVVQKTKFNIID